MAPQGTLMKHRERVLGLLLAGLLVPLAQAADDGGAVRFSPAPSVQVQATVQPDGRIAVRGLPAGAQQLAPPDDADGGVRLSAEDVDFDGRPELVARAAVGMVNEAVVVYRFDAASGRFAALAFADHGQSQCGGPMGLTLEAAQRVASSSCRSGPMWYVDLYRPDGMRMVLYRAERLLYLGDALTTALQLDAVENEGPLAVWSTYSATGAVEEHAINDGLSTPAQGQPLRALGAAVLPARLLLFDRPGAASTQRYLLRGDRVELLDEHDGWVQVRYRNAKRGAVLGWINVN